MENEPNMMVWIVLSGLQLLLLWSFVAYSYMTSVCLNAHTWSKQAKGYPTKYDVEDFHDYVAAVYERIKPFQLLSIVAMAANGVIALNLGLNIAIDSLAVVGAGLNSLMIVSMIHSYKVRASITQFVSSVEQEQFFAKLKRENKDDG